MPLFALDIALGWALPFASDWASLSALDFVVTESLETKGSHNLAGSPRLRIRQPPRRLVDPPYTRSKRSPFHWALRHTHWKHQFRCG